MTELSGHSVASGYELAIRQHTGANAFRHRDQHRVAHPIHVPEPKLRKQAGIGGIVQFYFQSGAALYRFPDVEAGPLQIRREDQALRTGVHAPRQADADAFKGFLRVLLAQAFHALDNLRHGSGGIGEQRQRFARKKPPIQIDHGDHRLGGAEIAYQHGQIVVQVEQGGPAPARQPRHGAFPNPTFLEQILDDQRNRAALQA